MNVTDLMALRSLSDVPTLDPNALEASAAATVAAFVRAGTAAHTARSYASAMRYWAAWSSLRYGPDLLARPVPATAAMQFVLDHLARPPLGHHALPGPVDAALVLAGAKGRRGPLAYATVAHRLAVLSKWHRLQGWPSPGDDPALQTLLVTARKAQARAGVATRKMTALALEPLQAVLDTCTDDGLRGLRDRALLLLAWGGGGRRRSEVVALQVADLRQLDRDTWLYTLGATKTDTSGTHREKPLRGEAAHALSTWLAAAQLKDGPLFRRLHRGGQVGATALGADQVARIVQRRARLAGLSGNWGGHSLRAGFVTEAGRQGVPLGEVMAMTEHRSVATVLGYFQAGQLLASRASALWPAPPDSDPAM